MGVNTLTCMSVMWIGVYIELVYHFTGKWWKVLYETSLTNVSTRCYSRLCLVNILCLLEYLRMLCIHSCNIIIHCLIREIVIMHFWLLHNIVL